MLAGKLAPDDGKTEVPQLHISYKPQKISPKSEGTVRMLLHEKIRDAYVHPQFVTDVMKPLRIDDIMDQEVQNLSGGNTLSKLQQISNGTLPVPYSDVLLATPDAFFCPLASRKAA